MLDVDQQVQELLVVQHFVPSVVPFVRGVLDAFPRAHATVIGKHYSTIPWVASELADLLRGRGELCPDIQQLDVRRPSTQALILDEGGRLCDRLPRNSSVRAGVEQTSSGNRAVWPWPTVLVCRSAAKLLFEAQIIARGIIRKLEDLDIVADARIGIIGAGALGGELARRLHDSGRDVVVHDVAQVKGPLRGLHRSLGELLDRSTLIIGATGRDCLRDGALDCLVGEKTFVSCSSSNREFAAVLRLLELDSPFGVAWGRIGKASVRVLNGGFPINFDREREWERPEEILLTRDLCLRGLLQAHAMAGPARGIMLAPSIQLEAVTDWLQGVSDRQSIRVPDVLSAEFFRLRSEGEHEMAIKPEYHLHSTTPGALESMRSHTTAYVTNVAGMDVEVLPGVWSPRYDWSSAFYIENFPDVEGLSFLEIGSGTGVISVAAGLRGAARVLAADVNPEAVRNTSLNFARHRLRNAQAVLSDGFAGVFGSFDLVTWNAPYHGSKPADDLERGCADEDYRGVRAFFEQVVGHLNSGGTVVFGFSESGDLPLIRDLIREAGLRVKRELSDWRKGYNCMLMELVRAEPGAG